MENLIMNLIITFLYLVKEHRVIIKPNVCNIMSKEFLDHNYEYSCGLRLEFVTGTLIIQSSRHTYDSKIVMNSIT